ncbi:hypothetical protein [Lactiplantibacillus plantarum]|uniref:hypothetical protein n=1 Tax=Lactiplantibacillus plantarum TaxID=1590 RepID=UPI0039C36BD6
MIYSLYALLKVVSGISLHPLQRGYTNVVNIAGSYAELVQYEYFNDQTTGRTSILTRT